MAAYCAAVRQKLRNSNPNSVTLTFMTSKLLNWKLSRRLLLPEERSHKFSFFFIRLLFSELGSHTGLTDKQTDSWKDG